MLILPVADTTFPIGFAIACVRVGLLCVLASSARNTVASTAKTYADRKITILRIIPSRPITGESLISVSNRASPLIALQRRNILNQRKNALINHGFDFSIRQRAAWVF